MLTKKNVDENFWFKPVFKEIILHSNKFFTKQFLMKFFGSNLFLRKSFCTKKRFDEKKFDENFWFKPVF